MSNINVVRYSINADKVFDTQLRREVGKGEITAFFLEAAHKELARRRREKALQELKGIGPLFPHIQNSTQWVRELRDTDEERMNKLGI
jgi:hypothetical protein